MRAALQGLLVQYGYTSNNDEEADLLTEDFAAKALEIEPKSALAKAALALIRLTANQKLHSNFNLAQTITLFDESITIDPNNAIIYNCVV